ncbi:glycoside hydrolase family 30 protein [Neptunicella marina]|uniref:Glycoside hydrolase family 30 protein n=1 Tax=Neptunicella marina TaxID=2125989 RepID=A0A8J6M360_9ALTE|nr:glycoside hydrolase family 30 protein [Neptunicella marina]MBC3767168.1 glycoside hydrolase family 30 protein [Neptunicella marina]
MNTKIVSALVSAALITAGCASSKPASQNAAVKPEPVNVSGLEVYTTAKDTDLRLSKTDNRQFADGSQPSEGEISIFVNPQVTFQEIIGIGGAITDASAEVFAKLPADKQQELLTAYYDKDQGIGYSFGRTTIHSSDFSSGSYTYIDEGDAELKSFSIEHDRQFRIPLIKKVIDAAGGHLTLFASPWSAPAFMKDSNNMLKGGHLLPEYADSWAKYYTRFIKAYEEEGIPIWGISVQNEPMATQTWESMIYTAEMERDFIKDHLGPALHNAGYDDKKLIAWDHNRDLIVERANTILGDPEAAKYVWGIGFHWYETWTGGDPKYDNLSLVHESYPDKALIFTEGTNERFTQEKYQYWPNAERYGDSMINDFNRGTAAWTDWNILLDQHGGPNHVGNFCFSPIHGDTSSGELIYTPTYYYIGHFSKFVRPGAKRVSTSSSRSTLLSTSFINPDNSRVSVVMNKTDKPVEYNFFVNRQEVTLTIPARAMQTLVY